MSISSSRVLLTVSIVHGAGMMWLYFRVERKWYVIEEKCKSQLIPWLDPNPCCIWERESMSPSWCFLWKGIYLREFAYKVVGFIYEILHQYWYLKRTCINLSSKQCKVIFATMMWICLICSLKIRTSYSWTNQLLPFLMSLLFASRLLFYPFFCISTMKTFALALIMIPNHCLKMSINKGFIGSFIIFQVNIAVSLAVASTLLCAVLEESSAVGWPTQQSCPLILSSAVSRWIQPSMGTS